MKSRNVILSIAAIAFFAGSLFAGTLADFDDLSLAPDSKWSGEYPVDGVGGSYGTTSFTSGQASFINYSDGDWGTWAGFAYSNKTDNMTAGYGNQFSSYAGNAHSGSNFAVGYVDGYNGFTPTMTLNSSMLLTSISVTNTTYAALSMLNGDYFTTAFGVEVVDSESGEIINTADDYFILTIEGFDDQDDSTGIVDVVLADYRFEDDSLDYILDTWKTVDLTSLGVVKSLQFSTSSSDYGVPTTFAVDTVVPEPMSIALLGLGGLFLRRRK